MKRTSAKNLGSYHGCYRSFTHYLHAGLEQLKLEVANHGGQAGHWNISSIAQLWRGRRFGALLLSVFATDMVDQSTLSKGKHQKQSTLLWGQDEVELMTSTILPLLTAKPPAP